MHLKLRTVILISFLAVMANYRLYAQGIIVPGNYMFYSADSLTGFDFKAALDNPDIRTYNQDEVMEYLRRKERNFVIAKYNIHVDPTQAEVTNALNVNLQPGKLDNPLAASACNNADFEDGDFTNWYGTIGNNDNSQNPLTVVQGPTLNGAPGINTLGANSAVTSCSWQTIVTTGTDPYGGFPMLDPGGGGYSVRIGGSKVNLSKGQGGCGTNAMDPGGAFGEQLYQTFAVTNANSLLTISYAVVLNDGGHDSTQEPYFSADVYDNTNTIIPCLSFSQECTKGSPPPGFKTSAGTGSGGSAVYYLPWTTHTFDLKPYIGTNITIKFTAAGCEPGGHFAYAYIDAICAQVWPKVAHTCTVDTLYGPPSGLAYSWTGPGVVSGATSQNAIVNVSGTYSVTVTTETSPHLCTYTLDTTVYVHPPIVETTTPTNIVCYGGKGSISSNVTGGAPVYQYAWNNGQTGTSDTALAPGTYTLTITDSMGCTKTSSATITSPTKITSTFSTTPSNCAANNGSATITVSGGTAGYTYLWNSGQTTSAITNVAAGSYSVTVTDAHNCVLDTTVVVPSSGAVITPTVASTNVLCNGASSGTVSVTGTTGGTPGYTYTWNTGATGTNVTGLPAGTYTVTAKDANGCVGTGTTTITQPTPIVPSAVPTNALCNGGNGSITTSGTGGGTPGYTYLWSDGSTASSITDVAGGYTVTITDKNNCVIKDSATITQPSAITATSTVTPPTCGSSNGSAGVATVAGGTPNYTYKWSNGATTSTITGIAVGNFTVTITDANNCTYPMTVSVPNSNAPVATITNSVNEQCYGQSIGSITVGVTNGTPGYTYSWAPAGGTGTTASALPIGVYTVTVTDAAGCQTSAIDTIKQPTKLTLSAAAFAASCNGECNGQLLSIPGGGTKPYSFAWSNGSTTTSVLNVCAGTYSLVLTDANGCTVDTTGLVVTQPTPVTAAVTPATAKCGQANGSVCLNGGTAGGGTPGYTYSWSNGASTTCINGLTPGPYTLIVTDANKCKDTVTTTVPNIPGDTAVITATVNELCNGGNNGSATGGGKGGTPPYTYLWMPTSQSTQTASNLVAGNYTVTVTDNIGCTSTATTTITQPAIVVATPSGPQTICIGQQATLTVSATGGTPGYTYTWTPGNLTGPSVTVSPVTTTTYVIKTVDANNCPGNNDTIIVTVNPPLSIKITPNQALCPGSSATLTAVVKGGDGIYTYDWEPPTGLNDTNTATVIATPATTTEYTVTVHDACGDVPVIDSVKVTVDPLPNVNFVVDTTNGCIPLCIKFNDTSTIASGNIVSWEWSFGDGVGVSSAKDTEYCYTSAGVYTVGLTVVSDSGCIDSLIKPNYITAYSHPIAKFTASPQPTTLLDPTLNFTDESTDAYGLKSWFWNFNDPTDSTSKLENPQHTFIDTGWYCPKLWVTNIHNCTDSVQNCIYIAPYFTLYIPNAFSPNGDGVNDVFTAKGMFVCSFGMYIFDRWGMELYYTNDINQGWDGTVNGGNVLCQEDTYVYLIDAVDCVEHKHHRYVGRVSLIK